MSIPLDQGAQVVPIPGVTPIGNPCVLTLDRIKVPDIVRICSIGAFGPLSPWIVR